MHRGARLHGGGIRRLPHQSRGREAEGEDRGAGRHRPGHLRHHRLHDHNAHQHTSQAKAFFEEMARTYGQHPNVIYELFNEPLAGHSWAGQIKPYHEAVIPVIRAHDPDNIIVLGTRSWSQDMDEASRNPVAGRNLAYTLHYYAATHKQSLRDKAATALRNGIALMVTEYGTAEASGGGRLDPEESKRWWKFLDENSISHCNWSVADLTETTAALKPGASSNGGWPSSQLSASGALVSDEIRSKNSQTTGLAPASGALPREAQWAAPGWRWGVPVQADPGGRVTGYRDARGRILSITPLPLPE